MCLIERWYEYVSERERQAKKQFVCVGGERCCDRHTHLQREYVCVYEGGRVSCILVYDREIVRERGRMCVSVVVCVCVCVRICVRVCVRVCVSV